MTHDYYEHHAATYFDATVHAALHDLHAAFVAALPAGAHILDAGCGSGRDSLAFLQHGYRVTAFDASAALVTLAEAWVRQQSADSRHFAITTRRFQQVAEQATYDGIWACASLLHVPAAELPDCLTRLWQALKPGGVLYCSFKHGHGERTDELGRHFTDADEEQLTRWVSGLSAVRETRLWQSADQTGREVVWVNGLVHKAITPANKLITGGQHPLLPELCRAINRAQEIDIAVAFVKSTGLKLLLPDLSQALAREGHPARIRFLASDYLDITDPPALRSLILRKNRARTSAFLPPKARVSISRPTSSPAVTRRQRDGEKPLSAPATSVSRPCKSAWNGTIASTTPMMPDFSRRKTALKNCGAMTRLRH